VPLKSPPYGAIEALLLLLNGGKNGSVTAVIVKFSLQSIIFLSIFHNNFETMRLFFNCYVSLKSYAMLKLICPSSSSLSVYHVVKAFM